MFAQLRGNDRVKLLLRRMLESGRIPGSMLLSGEEGVGKKLFALELARALNCRSPRGVEACGECSTCKRISFFHYPESEDPEEWKKIIWTDHTDVGLVVAPKRLLLVDQMRQIEREANFRPFEGKARIFLIDDADKLNEPAANALLKVLEEPPPTSHLILITARPAMLLPTIRSRCQAIRFSSLTNEEIEQYLVDNKLAPANEAPLRARIAGGSLSRALQVDWHDYEEQRQTTLEILNALALTDDRACLLRLAEEMNEASYKDQYESRLDILEALIRDVLMLAMGMDERRLTNEDLLPQLSKISARIDTGRATCWIAQIEELREQLVVNINRKPATDALLLRMAAAC